MRQSLLVYLVSFQPSVMQFLEKKQRLPVISVLRSSARPQGDGELKILLKSVNISQYLLNIFTIEFKFIFRLQSFLDFFSSSRIFEN